MPAAAALCSPSPTQLPQLLATPTAVISATCTSQAAHRQQRTGRQATCSRRRLLPAAPASHEAQQRAHQPGAGPRRRASSRAADHPPRVGAAACRRWRLRRRHALRRRRKQPAARHVGGGAVPGGGADARQLLRQRHRDLGHQGEERQEEEETGDLALSCRRRRGADRWPLPSCRCSRPSHALCVRPLPFSTAAGAQADAAAAAELWAGRLVSAADELSCAS